MESFRNALVDEFKALDQAAQKTKMSVPFEVIAAIDRGRNPQQMTYRMLCVFSSPHIMVRIDLTVWDDIAQ